MKPLVTLIALGYLAMMAASPVLAATSTASFSVTATVVDDCRVASQAITYGAYAAAAADPKSAVSVHCALNTPYNVGLRAGLAAVTPLSTTGRHSFFAGYAQLSASAHPLNAGWAVGGETVAKTGSASSQPLVVYGRTVETQSETVGDYPEAVTVTVIY